LYGRYPFEEGDAQLVQPSPERRVPAHLYAALGRGLETRPEARYATMEQLVQALERRPGGRAGQLGAGAGADGAVRSAGSGGCGGGGVVWRRRDREGRASGGHGSAVERTESAWGPARKEAVHSAFLKSPKRHAAQTWARTEHALDAYVADWRHSDEALCRVA